MCKPCLYNDIIYVAITTYWIVTDSQLENGSESQKVRFADIPFNEFGDDCSNNQVFWIDFPILSYSFLRLGPSM